MKNNRRVGALVAMATAAVGMAGMAAAPASAAPVRGPQPVSNWLGAVRANADSWVKINWRTDRTICDVEVRVSGGRDVDVDYPGRKRFTSFTRGDTLRPGRTDFTAFEVNPDYDRAGVARLRATISYDLCGRRDRTQYKSFALSLPVLRNNGHHTGPGRPGDGRPGDGRPGDGRPNGGHSNGGNNGGHSNGGHSNGGHSNGGHSNGGNNNGGHSNGGNNNGGHNNGGNWGDHRTQPSTVNPSPSTSPSTR
ncbi:hypothetical protein M1L60_19365 [Actinoplanes sp. TRM 88003]|uniref:Uncharacterized protein n=1 Tax=Paractinoplanes aksuensis TaxID=2939490 RepID=A0ABT1DQJ1_9ACTN|nr:hypothetical protein [Actinoplanes aksuensis]MCO8272758.1 hypothetical protein [Actinoplanes aksuensis]